MLADPLVERRLPWDKLEPEPVINHCIRPLARLTLPFSDPLTYSPSWLGA
jgi:hypothetical protein